ncbi:MAG: hypothetical protein E6J82_04485 [Deltaproteobacteria bacterium]|nr:MAG: hypothetical protein E6J82_04485 [Deltaproteobacteria bacterium]
MLLTGVREKAATPATNSAISPASSIDMPQETAPCIRLSLRRRSPARRTTANAPTNDAMTALTAPHRPAPALEAAGRATNGSMTARPMIIAINARISITPQPISVPPKRALQSRRMGRSRRASASLGRVVVP